MVIKIAIATHVDYYEMALPILIESLLDSGIERSHIHVFIAGYTNSGCQVIDEITYYRLSHNSYECSPLIEIVEREIQSDYWFLIHDTCRVGKNFKNLLYDIPYDRPEKLALKDFPSMSMGSYRYDYLMSVKENIISVKNTDYSTESLMHWKTWHVQNEDFILWRTSPSALKYGNNNWTVVDYENWYGTQTVRRTEYYESLDLYKNKSNWGQSDKWVITI